MSSLFLHIGSHKTGTTSIQQACRLHLSPSGNVGYFNIRPSGTRIVHSEGVQSQFKASIDLETAERVFRPDEKKRFSSFIASDEELFWIQDPENIFSFSQILKDRFSEVTVICYLRRQDLLAVSHRKQVMAGGMPASRFYGITATPLPEYQEHLHSYFDYAEKISNVWARSFGKENIRLVPYDKKELVNGDVVDDFSFRTGAEFSLSAPVRENAVMNGDQLLVGLKLAELGVPKPKRQRIISDLGGIGVFSPSRTEAERFLEHFSTSNKRLAQEWSWKGKPFRFDTSFDMYPDATERQWDNAAVENMLDVVLRRLLKSNRRGL